MSSTGNGTHGFSLILSPGSCLSCGKELHGKPFPEPGEEVFFNGRDGRAPGHAELGGPGRIHADTYRAH